MTGNLLSDQSDPTNFADFCLNWKRTKVLSAAGCKISFTIALIIIFLLSST